jgi:GntR family transcriptional regulator, transcriptional repressor for pyruvate dehydrogenase complex
MSDGRVVRFPSLGQEALYKRIAAHVRELIETRELQPGERLPPERDLARMLDVSRIPVREAMRTLAAQGLIEIRHGQGTFVAPRGVEAAVQELAGALLHQRHTFEELFAVRRLLEPASAQWAATRAGAAEIERLRRSLGAMEEVAAADPPDYETIGEHDAQLHLEIAAAAGNRVLLRIMQAIQDLHEQQLETSLRFRGRPERTVADHRRIVAAIAAGDPVEAGGAMLDHLDSGEDAALAGIDGLDESREVR